MRRHQSRQSLNENAENARMVEVESVGSHLTRAAPKKEARCLWMRRLTWIASSREEEDQPSMAEEYGVWVHVDRSQQGSWMVLLRQMDLLKWIWQSLQMAEESA